jgi:hypothetical protein
MYSIDKDKNNIVKLDERLFSDLKIREREHLQEWIAHNPDVLGEDLLIIQKEFDGFSDTQERLDLLALDKMGRIVIIENKLDDTGRDVVWQALKYTSYCSTLTTEQIVKIYQSYLDKNEGGNARENLQDFLEYDNEELILNDGDQRIMLVANKYRKEVTSTVLWLLEHDIQVQCFKATPYSKDEELFLDLRQIIPLPETEEFMIDMKEKEKDNRQRTKSANRDNAELKSFWTEVKNGLTSDAKEFFSRITPKGIYYMNATKGPGKFGFCIGREALRVELYFPNDADKSNIKFMQETKNQIEEAFGAELTWEFLDGNNGSNQRMASRIRFDKNYEGFAVYDGKLFKSETMDEYIRWFDEQMNAFYKALNPRLIELSLKK